MQSFKISKTISKQNSALFENHKGHFVLSPLNNFVHKSYIVNIENVVMINDYHRKKHWN